MNRSEKRLEALMGALIGRVVVWRAAGGAKRECAAELEAAMGGGSVPNLRVTDIMRGMGVVAGLISRRRPDIIRVISRDVPAALQVVGLVLLAAERDAEAFGARELLPSEASASFALLLDAIEAMFAGRAPS
jgi:hypothetical protein